MALLEEMPRERNRLLVAVFAKDGRGDITPKPMSQLHIHFSPAKHLGEA